MGNGGDEKEGRQDASFKAIRHFYNKIFPYLSSSGSLNLQIMYYGRKSVLLAGL